MGLDVPLATGDSVNKNTDNLPPPGAQPSLSSPFPFSYLRLHRHDAHSRGEPLNLHGTYTYEERSIARAMERYLATTAVEEEQNARYCSSATGPFPNLDLRGGGGAIDHGQRTGHRLDRIQEEEEENGVGNRHDEYERGGRKRWEYTYRSLLPPPPLPPIQRTRGLGQDISRSEPRQQSFLLEGPRSGNDVRRAESRRALRLAEPQFPAPSSSRSRPRGEMDSYRATPPPPTAQNSQRAAVEVREEGDENEIPSLTDSGAMGDEEDNVSAGAPQSRELVQESGHTSVSSSTEPRGTGRDSPRTCGCGNGRSCNQAGSSTGVDSLSRMSRPPIQRLLSTDETSTDNSLTSDSVLRHPSSPAMRCPREDPTPPDWLTRLLEWVIPQQRPKLDKGKGKAYDIIPERGREPAPSSPRARENKIRIIYGDCPRLPELDLGPARWFLSGSNVSLSASTAPSHRTDRIQQPSSPGLPHPRMQMPPPQAQWLSDEQRATIEVATQALLDLRGFMADLDDAHHLAAAPSINNMNTRNRAAESRLFRELLPQCREQGDTDRVLYANQIDNHGGNTIIMNNSNNNNFSLGPSWPLARDRAQRYRMSGALPPPPPYPVPTSLSSLSSHHRPLYKDIIISMQCAYARARFCVLRTLVRFPVLDEFTYRSLLRLESRLGKLALRVTPRAPAHSRGRSRSRRRSLNWGHGGSSKANVGGGDGVGTVVVDGDVNDKQNDDVSKAEGRKRERGKGIIFNLITRARYYYLPSKGEGTGRGDEQENEDEDEDDGVPAPVKRLRAMRCSVLWMAEEVISRRGIPISLVDTEEREQETSLLDPPPGLGLDSDHGGDFRDGYGRHRDADGNGLHWGRWDWRRPHRHFRHHHLHHPKGGKNQSGCGGILGRLFYGNENNITRKWKGKQKLDATERDSGEEEEEEEEEEENGEEEEEVVVEEVDWVSKVIGPRGRKTIALQQQLHLQQEHDKEVNNMGILRIVKKVSKKDHHHGDGGNNGKQPRAGGEEGKEAVT